jgi:tRNA A-37 threonylcarbamoyl transferase component Bud32
MSARTQFFLEARVAGLRIAHRADLEPALVVRAIRRHIANTRTARGECETYGPASSVSRVAMIGPRGDVDLAVKWNHRRGLRGTLSDSVQGSRAVRAAAGAQRLAAVGIGHPETLAVAERRHLGIVTQSFLLARFVDGSVPLSALAPGLRHDARRRRALIVRIGDVIGTLHSADLDHSDLKHSNLLVTPGDRVALLDLDSVAVSHRITWRRRVRALGQLDAYARDLYPWLSRSDRLRFLQAYMRREPRIAARRRELIADVTRWAERRLASWAARKRYIHYPLVPREPAPEAVVSAEEG